MKEIKGKRKGKEKRKKKKERKEEKGRGVFPAFRRSKLDSPSTKVGTHSAIYVWIPKTWSFDKLHKVRNFPTRFTFSLMAV